MTSSDASSTKSYHNMARNMADEVERRRIEWQKEVERMQQNFFKTKLNESTSPSDSQPMSAQLSSSSPKILTSSSSVNATSDVAGMQRLPDGSVIFRARFDVSGYKPDEVSVRVVDDGPASSDSGRGTLVVSARHEELDENLPPTYDVIGSSNGYRRLSSSGSYSQQQPRRHSREFSRQVELPSNVDRTRLVSRLAFDGILTVEAPVIPPSVDSLLIRPRRYTIDTASNSSDWAPAAERRSEGMYVTAAASPYGHVDAVRRSSDVTTDRPPRAVSVTSSSIPDDHLAAMMTAELNQRVTSGSRLYQVVETGGYQLLKLELDLGSADYTADDVRVIVHAGRKLGVVARHETTSPSGRTTRRQFSRELDVNEPIDRASVRAALNAHLGRLYVVAAIFVPAVPGDRFESGIWPTNAVGPGAVNAVLRMLRSDAGSTSHTCVVELK